MPLPAEPAITMTASTLTTQTPSHCNHWGRMLKDARHAARARNQLVGLLPRRIRDAARGRDGPKALALLAAFARG